MAGFGFGAGRGLKRWLFSAHLRCGGRAACCLPIQEGGSATSLACPPLPPPPASKSDHVDNWISVPAPLRLLLGLCLPLTRALLRPW